MKLKNFREIAGYFLCICLTIIDSHIGPRIEGFKKLPRRKGKLISTGWFGIAKTVPSFIS
jgi:steroid 5-alpha reductase family enzyme